MQFIMDILPNELQILHNMGVFHYHKLPFILFLLKICIFPLTAGLIVFLLIVIIRKHSLIRGRLQKGLAIVIVLLLAVCGLSYADVFSKMYFARGYSLFLNHEDQRASNCFFRSVELDRSFVRPFYCLADIYTEGDGDTALLHRISEEADGINNGEVYAVVGKLFCRSGNYAESLKYFRKARKYESNDLQTGIGIVRNLIQLRAYDQAETELRQLRDKQGKNSLEEDELYYAGLIDFAKRDFSRAKAKIDALGSSDVGDPRSYILQGRILHKLGDDGSALQAFSRAVSMRKEVPTAYFEMAKIYYARKEYDDAAKMIRKSLYFDNSNSLAFALLCMIEEKAKGRLGVLKYDNQIELTMNNRNITGPIRLEKGKSVDVVAVVRNVPKADKWEIGLLEPYGFGIKADLVEHRIQKMKNGANILHITLSIEGLRPSRVNLNRPWVLNIVFVNTTARKYCNRILSLMVYPSKNKEGRILFVITEDHEQTGDFPHTDDTPNIPDINPYEIKVDLVKKGILADEIANRYGVKWSHMIDIGSSLLRLQWIQNGRYGGDWNRVWDEEASYFRSSLREGHDIQLHIHAYGIPGNRLFRQYYDPKTNTIRFRNSVVRPEIAKNSHGAWADNFVRLGQFNDPNSRTGSVYRGIRTLEGELHKTAPSYRVLFFRAGEYEFGKDHESERRSILSLGKNGILCDSDAILGSPFSRDFKFFKRVGKNVYFTNTRSIHERATSLLDIGTLEIVPVPKINAQDYVRPIDGWGHVKNNYDLCFKNGKIKNDIFILMEMYHLSNINWDKKWDNMDKNYGDWASMNDQFANAKKYCPKMEYVTISNAIKIYLDAYTPDILAIRSDEKKANDSLFEYKIKFYGKDIEVSPHRKHFVSIKPPSYFLGRIQKIELFHNSTLMKLWTHVNDYRDLKFTIAEKKGYFIKVYLAKKATFSIL